MSSPRRSPSKYAPRLADLVVEDKEKIALIVRQFSEACQQRDELSDVVKEQESQVHHLIRERWAFTQENTRLAREVEHLRQRLAQAEDANSEQADEARAKFNKLHDANRRLAAICAEQKEQMARQHRRSAEMEMKYGSMVTAMKCLELKLENSKKSIRKLRRHLDDARSRRCFPPQSADCETQTERDAQPSVRCCSSMVLPPPCAIPPASAPPPPPPPLPTGVTSSGPLSHVATRQASDASSGPISQSAAAPPAPPPPPPPAPQQAQMAPAADPAWGQAAPSPAAPGADPQVACQGPAASRWTLTERPGCPPGGGGGGGLLEWAAAADSCPCWHQASAAGQLALSPQAVEDWMLTKLFFSGRAPCTVSHVRLQ